LMDDVREEQQPLGEEGTHGETWVDFSGRGGGRRNVVVFGW
jgi:hypothetical protein